MHKKLFTLLLFSTLLLTFSTAHAAPQDVTIGDGTNASCQTQAAANALSNAVAAGGTIDFNCGPGVVTINANTNATDQTVVINGNGRIALSGENARQLFNVFGTGSLTLNNLILIDGDFGNGGAISINPQARVTINGGFLTSNHASTNGGGIYNQGILFINGTTLGSNSTTGNGGAIYNQGGTVTIHNAYFINNQAISGGGIAQVSGSLTIDTSAFRSHTVPGVGGALYIQGGTTHMENATLSNNQANQGGSIYKSSGSLTMTNLTFNENRASTGAAIYNAGGSTTVGNTIFTGSLDQNGIGSTTTAVSPTPAHLATCSRPLPSSASGRFPNMSTSPPPTAPP